MDAIDKEDLRRLREFFNTINEIFLARDMTPFKICKTIWRLHGELNSWRARNIKNVVDAKPV